ncbi:MAG: hypothetical protein ACI9F9_001435 [Candidatus Paceibacteria bacterium]|jgi:hypothetical protein
MMQSNKSELAAASNQDRQQELPIVANPGQPVTDERIARLLLGAMLDCEEVPLVLEHMVPILMVDSATSATHGSFIDGVVQILSELVQLTPNDECVVEWHRRAVANLQTTIDCARAYETAGLENPESVWFPMPTQPKNPSSVYDQLPWSKRIPLVDRSTKIGSAGSCFASEISFRFQREGYNYLIKEKNPSGENGLDMASANWGIIFNVPSLRQLVERSFGARNEPALVWEHATPDGVVYRDPWREQVEYSTKEEYQESWKAHLRASREVFEEAEVFVMTLGLNEVWELRTDGTAFARCPWQLSPALVRYRTPSIEENLENLETMWSLWKEHNPGVQLILSVSPVPLLATFRSPEQHVITANCSSKATMRVVAEQFANRHPDVHYFPSFETVMYCSEERWKPDNRHVNRDAVAKVMSLFDQMFMKDAPSQAAAPAPLATEHVDQPIQERAAWSPELQREEQLVHQLVRDGLARESSDLPEPLLHELQTYEKGLAHFAVNGTNDPGTYPAQRKLYTMTAGGICDVVSAARRHAHPPLQQAMPVSGVLGTLDEQGMKGLVEQLDRDGIAVFPSALSEQECIDLEGFGRQHPVRPLLPGGTFGEEQRYGGEGPQATRHAILDDVILGQQPLAELAFDPTLVAVAREYLRCEPVLTHAHMLWSQAVFNEPDSLASQLFHFDMNRLNFLKALIYLTDIDEKNGPHCYVRGSHRHKPDALWRDGRIPDSDIAEHFPLQDIFEIAGKRGTLLLVDTRGFHKGKMLDEGERLIFHMEYSDSLVGKALEPCTLPSTQWHKDNASANPRLWHRYQLDTTGQAADRA